MMIRVILLVAAIICFVLRVSSAPIIFDVVALGLVLFAGSFLPACCGKGE